jgi:WD40 repeat protein
MDRTASSSTTINPINLICCAVLNNCLSAPDMASRDPLTLACPFQVAVDDTGSIVVTCSDDGTAKVWDCDDGACKATLTVGGFPDARAWTAWEWHRSKVNRAESCHLLLT